MRSHFETADLIGSFQLIEGPVVSADVVRGRAYLNFGKDWRTDFTVSVEPKRVRLFRSEGLHPESYQGRRIRVRGWLRRRNGPMIEATYPEQIEILAELESCT